MIVVAEGVYGRERETGNLRVVKAGEDGRLGRDGDLEREAKVVVEEDVGDFGLGDIGVDTRHGVGKRRLLEDLFPEFRERSACGDCSLLVICSVFP